MKRIVLLSTLLAVTALGPAAPDASQRSEWQLARVRLRRETRRERCLVVKDDRPRLAVRELAVSRREKNDDRRGRETPDSA